MVVIERLLLQPAASAIWDVVSNLLPIISRIISSWEMPVEAPYGPYVASRPEKLMRWSEVWTNTGLGMVRAGGPTVEPDLVNYIKQGP